MKFKNVTIEDLTNIYGDYISKDSKLKNITNEDRIYLDENNNYVVIKKENKEEYKVYYNYKFDLINEIDDLVIKLKNDNYEGKLYIYDYHERIDNKILEEKSLKFFKEEINQMQEISEEKGLYMKDYSTYVYIYEM